MQTTSVIVRAGPRRRERGQQPRLCHDCRECSRSDRFRFLEKFANGRVVIAHAGPRWGNGPGSSHLGKLMVRRSSLRMMVSGSLNADQETDAPGHSHAASRGEIHAATWCPSGDAAGSMLRNAIQETLRNYGCRCGYVWQHVRCTPHCCRPIASLNSAALGQERSFREFGNRCN